jgi:hypothetical protein
MHPDKAEFKRLIEQMGWSKSEAARRLHKTPSAINHLVNPKHRNKPTKTTMELLNLIIARERPDLVETQDRESRRAPTETKPSAMRLSLRERDLIESMRRLSAGELETVYAVMEAMLPDTSRQVGKTKAVRRSSSCS